jgi:hypothetical protein
MIKSNTPVRMLSIQKKMIGSLKNNWSDDREEILDELQVNTKGLKKLRFQNFISAIKLMDSRFVF